MEEYKMPSEEFLYRFYHSTDKDKSGEINAEELQKALSNGTWKPFDLRVVKMMISMFDKDNNNTIDYKEFKQLWKYINDWLNCFRRFDTDNSGSIGKQELNQALNSFGYRFSERFYDCIIKKFGGQEDNTIIFDNFLYVCIVLQAATASFANYDPGRSGEIKIGYDQFLCSVLNIV